jgi:acyl-CoA reductase-like NAD-dependent aldehyde dehydrogenase
MTSARQLEAFGGDMTATFGGFKQSGNGRDKSLHAFDKYTELKAT